MQEEIRHTSDAEVALELTRLPLEQACGRRIPSTLALATCHLCKEAVAHGPEGNVSYDYPEGGLKKLLQ